MQPHLGARDRNAELERESRNTEVTDALSAYLAERTSILLATAAKSGWPYVQHRSRPKGFEHTLGRHTLAFADYPGNKLYITLGNLAENQGDHPRHRLCTAAAGEDLGRGRIGRRRSRPARCADAGGQRRLPHARDPLPRAGVGHQLPQPHSTALTLEEVEAASAAMLARIAELEADIAKR